ncbi:hypothetical protein V6N13_084062 [Hibiscus sabdariffa]
MRELPRFPRPLQAILGGLSRPTPSPMLQWSVSHILFLRLYPTRDSSYYLSMHSQDYRVRPIQARQDIEAPRDLLLYSVPRALVSFRQ